LGIGVVERKKKSGRGWEGLVGKGRGNIYKWGCV